MNKVQVDILGLSVSPASNGAYALILKESDGARRLPIVIGGPEAQAIANELEGIKAQRPMTHDLLRSVIEALGGHLREVVINNLKEGTFYASLVFEYTDQEIDSRPSDAIALAVRCGVPIFVSEEIMQEASFKPGDEELPDAAGEESGEDGDEEEDELSMLKNSAETKEAEPQSANLTYRQRLEQELNQAINIEDYEKAARLRDELQRLTGE